MQILPSENLRDIIKHYLFLDGHGYVSKKLRFFSDGNTGMVFTTNQSLSDENNNKLPNSFLYGQISHFKDLTLTTGTSIIIAVFQPAGINKFLRIPAFELCDSIINVEDIIGKQVLEMESKLTEASTIPEKLQLLNRYFSSLAIRNTNNKESCISAMIHYILQNKGIVSSSQLVKFTGYTERHIERMFLETIGTSPKSFTNIVRLNNFLQQVKAKHTIFTEIAYNVGYADQSHLIREFKKHTGITPSLYKNKTNKLTINLVALPALIN